jgi:hypothetical protein
MSRINHRKIWKITHKKIWKIRQILQINQFLYQNQKKNIFYRNNSSKMMTNLIFNKNQKIQALPLIIKFKKLKKNHYWINKYHQIFHKFLSVVENSFILMKQYTSLNLWPSITNTITIPSRTKTTLKLSKLYADY